MGRLDNRTALVTAAGSGMGRAASERFAAEGAHVYVTDVKAAAAAETAELIESAGGQATALTLDVTDKEAIAAVIERIESDAGALHVLMNHAGTPGPSGLGASEAEWNTLVDVNLKSAYYVTSLAVDLLRRADGKASVIFTASVSALTGSPFSPLYSLAKGGIVSMMRALALSLASDGVRCNAICPASVKTPMLRGFLDRRNEGLTEEQMEEFARQTIPLGRAAEPEEIANVALFLASDESSFVTGVALPVDGGYTAR